MTIDQATLDDLVTFARLEQQSGDIEPWAAVLGALHTGGTFDREAALWAVHLYNATDDLGSAFKIYDACPTADAWWLEAGQARDVAARVYLGGERRNLRGGKILRRLDSYADQLAGSPQDTWLTEPLVSGHPTRNFPIMMRWLQQVWGVGRLAAFEWAEFLAKVGGYPIDTTDGALWESSGPRESLTRIYNGDGALPTLARLTGWAEQAKTHLADQGVALSWWDFETVICDFNVMRKGRYYPGKHLAMISEEIEGLDERWREPTRVAYRSVIPTGWRDLPPGVDKTLAGHYRATGQIRTPALEDA